MNSIAEDAAPIIGNVLANDSDVDNGAVLTASLLSPTAGTFGDLTLAPNGDYTYSLRNGDANVQALALGEVQHDIFTYEVSDGNGGFDTETLDITITGTNDGPTAFDDTLFADDTVDASVIALGNILDNDTDPDAGDTKDVVSAAFSSTDMSPALASEGGLNVSPGTLGVGEIAHFIITPTGSLANEPIVSGGVETPAELIINEDGSVTLIKNNAFDFLPDGESLTLHFTYTMEDSASSISVANLDITITGTDNHDVHVGIGGSSLTGGLQNDLIIGSNPGGGDQANYSSDVLNTQARAFIGAALPSLSQMQAVSASGNTILNYALALQMGSISVTDNVGSDGADQIAADTTTVVNQVLIPTANSTSSVDLIDFDGHTYLLYNGAINPPSSEWIAPINAPDTEGSIVVGGDFNTSIDYYVLQGHGGDDIIIGGTNTITTSQYGYFVIGEGGSDVVIGGENAGNLYYVAALDNQQGTFAPDHPVVVGNSILVGGSNTGNGQYTVLGSTGNDVIFAGSNALGNSYDSYYLSGGGGTNIFISNTGKHVFDGSNGAYGASIFNVTQSGLPDTNDIVQYHFDMLNADVRDFLDETGTADNVISVLESGDGFNYNLSLFGFDPFANKGGILVDSINDAEGVDGHDLLVGDTTITNSSSIKFIDFNGHVYTLINGLFSSAGVTTIGDTLGDDIIVGGASTGSGTYTISGGSGHDILLGGVNSSANVYTVTENVSVTGPSGLVGNEALVADSTNAEVILSHDMLVSGMGANNMISIIGKTTGGNGNDTFGNHAKDGFTAISADTQIHHNILIGNGSSGDTLLISAEAKGGNAGSAGWVSPNINTGGNVADGPGSLAISARAVIHDNLLIGGVSGASLTMNANATGGIAPSALYGNHAINQGTAISAQAVVTDNNLDGYGDINSDTLTITAIANGGTGTAPAFSGNVSGFNPDDNPDHFTAGGTAISAQAIVDGNVLTEHGSANAVLEIHATANGGNGQYFGNYAVTLGSVASLAVSADVEVTSNILTGGSGNDQLSINVSANGGTGNNISVAGPNSTATWVRVNVADNSLNGGLGNDTLKIMLDYTVHPSNSIVVSNNEMHGGGGNDILIYNNLALLGNGSGNLLDGGTGVGFDTLIQQISGGSLDLTLAGVVTGTGSSLLQEIEKIDLLGNGTNSLTLNGVSVDNMNGTHDLFVTGDGGDTVNLGAGWSLVESILGAAAGNPLASDAGVLFTHYTQMVGPDAVDLYVQAGMTVIEPLDNFLVKNGNDYYSLPGSFGIAAGTSGSGLGTLNDASAVFLGLGQVDLSNFLDEFIFSIGSDYYYLETNFNNVLNVSASGTQLGTMADPNAIFVGIGHVSSSQSGDQFVFKANNTYYELSSHFFSVFNIQSAGTELGTLNDPNAVFVGIAQVDVSSSLHEFIFKEGDTYYSLPANFGAVFDLSTTGQSLITVTDPNATFIGFGHVNGSSSGDQFIFKEGDTYYDVSSNLGLVNDLSTQGHSLGTILDNSLILGAGHLI